MIDVIISISKIKWIWFEYCQNGQIWNVVYQYRQDQVELRTTTCKWTKHCYSPNTKQYENMIDCCDSLHRKFVSYNLTI